jgi:GNAT superfamily N-acetyltransferase
VPAYRFCRTDDIAVLVDALNRCWAPYWPAQPPTTAAVFKRSIRDLQVWCSSCMVASSDAGAIGVLIGARRPAATLVHRIAVHPDHRRRGHGRHLLASLGSKLAILGPQRIVAEVPDASAPGCALFSAAGYVQDTVLTDYVRAPGSRAAGSGRPSVPQRGGALAHRFVIPVSVDDLAANGLLDSADHDVCWERSPETLMARKDEIAGLAVASEDRIEAGVLYVSNGAGPDAAEILWLRSFVEDDGARLGLLLCRLAAAGIGTTRIVKVNPAESSKAGLEAFGFRPDGSHRRFVATAGA